jgi:hypothetical protein
MEKDVLSKLLAAASGAPSKDGRFTFDKTSQGTLLLESRGGLLQVEGIVSIVLHDGFCEATTAKGEVFIVLSEMLLGVKVQRAQKEGAGFVP